MNVYIYTYICPTLYSETQHVLMYCMYAKVHLSMFKSPTNKPVDLSIALAILSTSTLASTPGSPAVWAGHIPGDHPEGRSPRNDSKSACK